MIHSKCALCGKQGNIKQSHIIPKFALKWIKNTSATGYLASAVDGARRIQDGIKLRLLCDDCEQRFSKPEKYFAEKIFYTFHKHARSFAYDERLEYYATSLSWRALKLSYSEATRGQPKFAAAVDRAEACWREFLLGKRRSISPYENHLIFLGDNTDLTGSSSAIWYGTRGVDSTLAMSTKVAFAYSLLPRMAVVTTINPMSMEGWRGTLIKPCGKIRTTQIVSDMVFWEFVENRALWAIAHTPGPSIKESRRRLRKAMDADPERVLGSEIIGIALKEKDEEIRIKLRDRKMPQTIITLIEDVIMRSKSAHVSNATESKLIRMGLMRIADILTSLPKKDAEKICREIESTKYRAVKSREHEEVLVKTDRIWIVFMVYHNSTKKVQHDEIQNKINGLKLQQTCADTPIAVFSMNLEGDESSFESGFTLPNNSLESKDGKMANAVHNGRGARADQNNLSAHALRDLTPSEGGSSIKTAGLGRRSRGATRHKMPRSRPTP